MQVLATEITPQSMLYVCVEVGLEYKNDLREFGLSICIVSCTILITEENK